MPTILTGSPLSTSDLFALALEQARTATARIHELETTSLGPDETIEDRVRSIAFTGRQLADAFRIIDAIAEGASVACISSPSPSATPPHRGVRGDDPEVN